MYQGLYSFYEDEYLIIYIFYLKILFKVTLQYKVVILYLKQLST